MGLIEIGKLYEEVRKRIKDRGIPDNTLVGLAEKNFMGGSGENGYLWDTPHGNWTGSASVETGHSDAFLTKVRTIIGDATEFVDITTMKVPDDRFWTVIKAALRALAQKQRHVKVRLLIGFPIDYTPPDLWKRLEDIAAALKIRPGYLRVDLGIYRYYHSVNTYPTAWNHSKIIAVDGKTLLTGGHNLWTEDYLGLSPVFDLSMQIDGPIAGGGHAFANGLWNFIRKNRGAHTYSHRMWPDLTITDDPPGHADIQSPPGDGKLSAMWVTQSGRGVFRDSAEKEVHISGMQIAFVEALKTASHCRISQQSFGSHPVSWSGGQFDVHQYSYLPFRVLFHKNKETGTTHAFNFEIIQGLVGFLVANHQKLAALEILMTPPDGGSYSNGEAAAAILDILAYRMSLEERFRNLTKEQLVAQVNKQVWLCWPAITGKNGAVRHWSHNGKPMVNHSKFWMLNERLLYVGSENLYPSVASRSGITAEGGLQEFGIIVEVDDTVRDLVVDQYHALAMKYGHRRPLVLEDLTF